jgi:hypothetical protein
LVRRSKSRKRKSPKNWLYIGVGSTLMVGVFAVLGTLFWLTPNKIERNSTTLCPVNSSIPAITAIIIDRTDSFGAISKADIEVQIRDILNGAEENELVSLFVVEPTEKSPLKALIEVCNPGNPQNTDPWTQNKKLVERNWKTKFHTPLDDLLNRLLVAESANVSPIMESIQSVSITTLGGHDKSNSTRRIILISDLMQHSKYWSLYTQEAKYSGFQQGENTQGLNPDLRDISVELFYLQRQTKRKMDEKNLLRFWKEWIESYGGRVTRILKISGMNG